MSEGQINAEQVELDGLWYWPCGYRYRRALEAKIERLRKWGEKVTHKQPLSRAIEE